MFKLSQAICMVVTSLFVFLGFSLAVSAAETPKLPAGFDAAKIAEGLNSTALVVLPDGRVLITEKHGVVRVVKNDVLLPLPLARLSDVETNDEQGLDGMAVHPQFAKNGYIYLYYTVRSGKERGLFNRVCRFTVKGDIAVGKETVIFETDRAENIHNGGAMCFGPDGKLYVGSGEVITNGDAQKLDNLRGKVLRLNDDGSIPTDNPFVSSTTGKNRAIYSYGYRQPFKASFQPGTKRFYLNVVSTSAREAIFEVKSGDNGGWPESEGYTTNTKFHSPVFAYGGIGGCITGGTFCNSPQFPKRYQGRDFFMDYNASWIRSFDPVDPQKSLKLFATNLERPVDLAFAPDGSLYCLNRGNGKSNTISDQGTLWRISCSGESLPAQLAFTVPPQDSLPGAPFPKTMVVAFQDSKGKTLPFAEGEVTVTISGQGKSTTVKSIMPVQSIDGVASFPDLAIEAPGKGYTITAKAPGLPQITSAPFEISARVARPQILPGRGKFSGPVTVRLTTATPNAQIHYTIDGSRVTSSSPVYREPILLKQSGEVRALATREGLAESQDQSETLTIEGDQPYGLPFRPELQGVNLPKSPQESPPTTLSKTGVFRDVAKLQIASGFVPYEVISPLWSDGAEKQRWIGLPRQSRIEFSSDREWKFPPGTVFVKHFELALDAKKPTQRTRLETRLLIVDESEARGFGLTYKWRADQAEADLVDDRGVDQTLTIQSPKGVEKKQMWHFPGRMECLACHTANADFVLGVNTRQLNSTVTYPGGKRDNQLRTWTYLQMFDRAPQETEYEKFPTLVKLDDPHAALATRVRSYLDANCAHCHRPGGAQAQFDARFSTPLERSDVIRGALRNELGLSGSKVIMPRDLTKSMLHRRLGSNISTQKMPPLAHDIVDAEALELFEQWISSMDDRGNVPGKQ
jgi:uncharacterized repeat protein (TIGR03806 family)